MHILNFPVEHNEIVIKTLCSEFGTVTSVELIKDEAGKFNGEVYVDFDTEFQAKEAFSKMMGLEIGKKVLYVKKVLAPNEDDENDLAPQDAANDEIFR